MPVGGGPQSELPCPLTDEQLLEMCQVAQDDVAEAAPSVAALRAAARKVQKLTWTPNDAEPLAQAAALVAWALGRLCHWAPTEGYDPLRAEHRGSVRIMAVHGVVAQLLGLLHPQKRADAVADRAEAAIEEAVTYVYLTKISYDAWHPGMPTGKGWCMLVKTTTLGMAKAGGELRDAVQPGSTPAPGTGAPLPPWRRQAEPPAPPVVRIGTAQERADACAPAFKPPQPADGGRGPATPGEPRSSSAAREVERPAAPPAVKISNWQEGAVAIATAFQTKTKVGGEACASTPAPAYTVAALRDMTGLGNTAVSYYAKLAQVPTPQRGERNFRYPHADVRAILKTIIAHAGEERVRAKCQEALQRLPEITE